MRTSKITLEQKEKIIKLRDEGLTMEHIADLLSFSTTTISKICKKNTSNKFASKITPEIAEQILSLQKQGLNSVQISKLFDLNRNTVTKFARDRGVPFKRGEDLTPEQEIELEQCKRLRKNFYKAIHRVLREREDINKYHYLSDIFTIYGKRAKRTY